MRIGVFAAAVLLCHLGTPRFAFAQAVPPELGARVRLTIPCEGVPQPVSERRNMCMVVGTLAGWRTDAIDLEAEGRRSSYSLNTVSQVEVSRGSRSRKLLGAGIGFVVGIGSTYRIFNSGASSSGSTSRCNQARNQDAIDPGDCVLIYGLGGLAGAGLGALIGSVIRTERWQRVVPGRVRISLLTEGRFTLKLAVAF